MNYKWVVFFSIHHMRLKNYVIPMWLCTLIIHRAAPAGFHLWFNVLHLHQHVHFIYCSRSAFHVCVYLAIFLEFLYLSRFFMFSPLYSYASCIGYVATYLKSVSMFVLNPLLRIISENEAYKVTFEFNSSRQYFDFAGWCELIRSPNLCGIMSSCRSPFLPPHGSFFA